MRQSTKPVPYTMTNRVDNMALQTSGRAGVMVPVSYIPVLRGDSVGGQVSVDVMLNHMPKPLLNSVICNVQAWFVPKSAHPQFTGWDDFIASYQGEDIPQVGGVPREPVPFFRAPTGSQATTLRNSTILKTLGVHIGAGVDFNDDLFDAYELIWNFRAAAHSSKIARRQYMRESPSGQTILARAFWPQNRFSRVVPDYERALVVGAMNLDVLAGQVPVSGIGFSEPNYPGQTLPTTVNETDGPGTGDYYVADGAEAAQAVNRRTFVKAGGVDSHIPAIFAEMAGQQIGITLADLDKARVTQAMAKMRASMAGADTSGFMAENTILAEMMQGLRVPEQDMRRPWLLGQRMVPFGLMERHATDSAGLEQSTTRGRANVTIPINLPAQDAGGMIMVVMEVIPERIYERQGDPAFSITDVDELPNALRDVQRVEPVDHVENWRVDERHTNRGGLYGYEPMNDRWNREFTRLGGVFYSDTPGSVDWSEARSAIWAPEIIDPDYTEDHFLAPHPFPHDVFSDTDGPAWEATVRHGAIIRGLTQIGDILHEDNDDYDAVTSEE